MNDPTVKAKSWSYLSPFHVDKMRAERLPGVPFSKLFMEMGEANVKFVEVTITEIVDWDMAPMRKYFHAAVVENFTNKFNSTTGHPNHHFHTAEVKDFLKAKFLGWDKSHPLWDKWSVPLGIDKPIQNIQEFLKVQELNQTIKPPIKIISTTTLDPEQYMTLINVSENYYFELFQEMYEKKEKPVL